MSRALERYRRALEVQHGPLAPWPPLARRVFFVLAGLALLGFVAYLFSPH